MTNKELIQSIKKKTGFTTRMVMELLSDYVHTFDQFLAEGDTVALKSFGSFEPVEKAERKFFNPRTKQYKTVPKKKSVKFKPSIALKNLFKEESV